MVTPLAAENGNKLLVVGQALEHVVGSIQSIVRQFIFAGQGHQLAHSIGHGFELTDIAHKFSRL